MLDKIKTNLMKRIKSNSTVKELTYKDNKNIEHTKNTYLKHGRSRFSDWHEIHSPIDEETNKWNLINLLFGGWGNFFKLLFIMFCIYEMYSFTINTIGDAKEYMDGNKYVIMKIEDFKEFCTNIDVRMAVPIVSGNLSKEISKTNDSTKILLGEIND